MSCLMIEILAQDDDEQIIEGYQLDIKVGKKWLCLFCIKTCDVCYHNS